jgi:SAM-dependent methyltransferase
MRDDAPVDTAASGAAWRALVDRAAAPYGGFRRFAWHFARSKLRMDPVFRHLLSQGLLTLPQAGTGVRVLDIGCGQGVLAGLLLAAGRVAVDGGWPTGWAPPPRLATYTGIDLMPREIGWAQAAFGDPATFTCADMRRVPLPPCEVVVLLDVLHYVAPDDQDTLLARAHSALVPGGRLLLRVGDASASGGFRASQWVDRIVTRVRGNPVALHGRTLPAWRATLADIGFAVRAQPMSQGTPFSNVLLVADRRGSGVRP